MTKCVCACVCACLCLCVCFCVIKCKKMKQSWTNMGVSVADWNLPLERFGNVSIKKTNVSHRVDKLWEMALRGQFSIHSKVHCTLYLVQPPLTTLMTLHCAVHALDITLQCTVCTVLCCNKLHFCAVIHRPSAPQYMLLNFPLLVLFSNSQPFAEIIPNVELLEQCSRFVFKTWI